MPGNLLHGFRKFSETIHFVSIPDSVRIRHNNNRKSYSGSTSHTKKKRPTKTFEERKDFGWMVNSDGEKSIPWLNSCNSICKDWSEVGKVCKDPRNCGKNHNYYINHSDNVKSDITKIVSENTHLSFQNDASKGGTESKTQANKVKN